MTDLIKGRLTEAEKDRIAHLAETLRDPKPAAIARRLKRHPATVTWFMIQAGLIKRQITYRDPPVVRRRRDGVVTTEYSRDQDQRLIEMRRAGKPYSAIAAAVTAEFGVRRTVHSVHVRLAMLAAYEGGEA